MIGHVSRLSGVAGLDPFVRISLHLLVRFASLGSLVYITLHLLLSLLTGGGLAVELTRENPDVLVAVGVVAARAAQKATQRIPIVAMADDLIGSKLVASMPRPEGNTTGGAIFAFAFQLDVKRLKLLHEALPGARRIAVLADHSGWRED
ncbi:MULTISPECIES: ABC transporter substrate binding protein [unclassified Bradyrhizobium]|uniref:ABC transporter substrate binding protein n=1 Tax=unclassified Bradyrhizobium TaxID=2631580 RepID=UPI001FF8A555|nr:MULTISPECIES: ABC transporter substrate binding protein [unclassified Bradyrhizobium]